MATLPRLAEPARSPSLEFLGRLLNIQQAPQILGISRCTQRNWVQHKKIARVRAMSPNTRSRLLRTSWIGRSGMSASTIDVYIGVAFRC